MVDVEVKVETVWTEEVAMFERELRLPLEIILVCTQMLRESWSEMDKGDRAFVLGQIRYAVKRQEEMLEELEGHVLWRAYQRKLVTRGKLRMKAEG